MNWTEVVVAFAWPVAAVVIVIILAVSTPVRQILDRFAGRVGEVSALGVTLKLTPEAAQENKFSVERTFAEYRDLITKEYARLVHVHRLEDKLRTLVREVVYPCLSPAQRAGTRATIYCADVLFDQCLVQLTNYYPSEPDKAGRVFSIRYGIIGQAWRTDSPQIRADIPTAMLIRGPTVDPEEGTDQLVRNWALTREEADQAAYGRQSFACLPLREGSSSDGTVVGLLYLDHKEKDVFGSNDADATSPQREKAAKLIEAVRDVANMPSGVSADLAKILERLRERGPAIRITQK